MTGAYYNEHDPQAAAWLRELIRCGLIADGEVDTRSIEDVIPTDLAGFRQCHFFAGIGVWSYALRCAGIPDDYPVWTGSCPCQPFSAAGKGKGFADERHLWPAFFHLIEQCQPYLVLGEQVEGKDGLAWLDLVSADLEGVGYTFGANVAPAAGFGAPIRRHRIYWVALDGAASARRDWPVIAAEGDTRGEAWMRLPNAGRAAGIVASADIPRLEGRGRVPERAAERLAWAGGVVGEGRPGPVNGFWRDADWLFCRDERWRPVRPGSFPLADGPAAAVVRLRGFGNAINAQHATAFCEAVMEALP